MVKPVKPWPADTECPLPGSYEFKKMLEYASYHNAADGTGEIVLARNAIRKAAELAIEKAWPLWVIERQFREVKPLVEYNGFLQTYINILYERQK